MSTPDVVGYDFSPCIAKAHRQQTADLVDGILQDAGLHLWVITQQL